MRVAGGFLWQGDGASPIGFADSGASPISYPCNYRERMSIDIAINLEYTMPIVTAIGVIPIEL